MDFSGLTDEQLEAERDQAHAALEIAQREVGKISDAEEELFGAAREFLGKDEQSRAAFIRKKKEVESPYEEVSRRIRDWTEKIAAIDAEKARRPTFSPVAPAAPQPRPRVESVVDDLGDGKGAPIGRPRPKLPTPAILAAVVAVVILSTVGVIWRGTGTPKPAPLPTSPTRATTATTTTTAAAPTPPAPTPNLVSAAVALHGEGNTIPRGAGCSHPGSVHFTWTVRDANPGDKVVVALTGAGMPPTVEVDMPADLKPVVEVPLPLNTSAQWTAHVESIAGKKTNDSMVWTASTGATCNA